MTDFTTNSTDSDSEVWIGATEIAGKILGNTSPRAVRRVRWMHESNQLPTFKINRNVCLRPATWRQYLATREAEAEALRAAGQSDAGAGA